MPHDRYEAILLICTISCGRMGKQRKNQRLSAAKPGWEDIESVTFYLFPQSHCHPSARSTIVDRFLRKINGPTQN